VLAVRAAVRSESGKNTSALRTLRDGACEDSTLSFSVVLVNRSQPSRSGCSRGNNYLSTDCGIVTNTVTVPSYCFYHSPNFLLYMTDLLMASGIDTHPVLGQLAGDRYANIVVSPVCGVADRVSGCQPAAHVHLLVSHRSGVFDVKALEWSSRKGALIRQDTYQRSRSKNRYPVCFFNCLRMGEKMFHIVGCQIISLGFGSCCDNRCIFQVDKLCRSKDFSLGWPGHKGRKEVGKNRKVGKCHRRVLGEISFCLFQHQIADRQSDTPFNAFENQPACWSCCRKCGGIQHTTIEKNSPLGFR
jgi:hypothetical protein